MKNNVSRDEDLRLSEFVLTEPETFTEVLPLLERLVADLRAAVKRRHDGGSRLLLPPLNTDGWAASAD